MKFNVDIGSHKLTCTEISVKQYKELLKCIWPENPAPASTLDSLFELFSELADKPVSFFYTLSLLELFMFILGLRIQTFGPICNLTVKNDEDKQVTVNLNLIPVYQITKQVYHLTSNTIIDLDGLKVKLSLPKITRLFEKADEGCLLFLDEITTTEGTSIQIETNKQAQEFFDAISPKLAQIIFNKAENIANEIQSINFFSTYSSLETQKLPLFTTADILLWYTKLFFSEELDTLYDNIFYLSHIGHMDANYIENCTPGEYIFFVKKLEHVLQAKQEAAGGNTQQDDHSDLDEMSEE
jgi:hypothetical protein